MPKKILVQKNSALIKKVGTLIGLVIVAVFIAKSGLFCSQAKATCEITSTVSQVSTEITPQYFTFSQEKLAESLATGKTAVLYFHAPWCTSCSSFDQELTAQKSQLPTDVIVLKIDYDSATQLRSQYNVTYQHTLVLLNEDGTTKEMWIGGDLKSLLEYLKRNS